MIPESAVEAAAIASYVRAGGGTPESWPREEEYYRREYLEDARVQLEAAAPHMLNPAKQEAWDANLEIQRLRSELSAAPHMLTEAEKRTQKAIDDAWAEGYKSGQNDAARKAADAEVRRPILEAQAEAWNFGYEAGRADMHGESRGFEGTHTNPFYR